MTIAAGDIETIQISPVDLSKSYLITSLSKAGDDSIIVQLKTKSSITITNANAATPTGNASPAFSWQVVEHY